MPKITEVWAFVMADEDEDDEGIPAFNSGDYILPLIGADLERVKSLRKIAQKMADAKQKSLKLLRFTNFEVVEVLEPLSLSREELITGIKERISDQKIVNGIDRANTEEIRFVYRFLLEHPDLGNKVADLVSMIFEHEK